MSEPIGDDPLDRLRQEDSVDAGRLSSASLARVRARFQESSMIHGSAARGTASTRWRLAFGGLAAATVALAMVVLIAPRATGPGVTPSPSGGPISAACVETYSLESLSRRSFAFVGTVASFNGDEVTFDVNEAFRGVAGDHATLTATGMTGAVISSAGGPSLMPGGRYLVAGDDHFVWACGLTQDYDPNVAASWRSTLGR
jgi:hypothetical protein